MSRCHVTSPNVYFSLLSTHFSWLLVLRANTIADNPRRHFVQLNSLRDSPSKSFSGQVVSVYFRNRHAREGWMKTWDGSLWRHVSVLRPQNAREDRHCTHKSYYRLSTAFTIRVNGCKWWVHTRAFVVSKSSMCFFVSVSCLSDCLLVCLVGWFFVSVQCVQKVSSLGCSAKQKWEELMAQSALDSTGHLFKRWVSTNTRLRYCRPIVWVLWALQYNIFWH